MSFEADKIIEQNKKVYNEIADHFSSTRSFLWHDLDFLSQFVKPGNRVLDVGCGNGRLYQLFSEQSTVNSGGASVIFFGLDNSEKLIGLAKKKYPNGEFTVGDMRQLPYEDNFFDVVFNIVSFHHLPTEDLQLDSLKEMRRVLKPGGKVIMLNWHMYSKWVNEKIISGGYKKGDLPNTFIVPWETAKKERKGDRVYYGFHMEELENLFKKADLKLIDQYFLRHGERSTYEMGMNIVSVVGK